MTELRRTFHDRLAAVRADVVAMADAVVAGLDGLAPALLMGDSGAADHLAALHHRVEDRLASVEGEVLELLATQAPVGRDLRVLVASLRVAQEVERASSLVVSTSRRAAHVAPAIPAVTDVVGQMTLHASRMWVTARGAYATLDPVAAAWVVGADDVMDALQRLLLERLFALGTGPVEPAVELGLVSRFLERLADHAVVAADRVRFVASGAMPHEP